MGVAVAAAGSSWSMSKSTVELPIDREDGSASTVRPKAEGEMVMGGVPSPPRAYLGTARAASARGINQNSGE